MVARRLVQMRFLPLSYVQEGMSCCSTSTTSSLPPFLSVIFLFRGEVPDWSTSAKKGKTKNRNNWRGLYVGDHASKILSFVLAQQLLPSCVQFVGPCQFLATPQMGVTLASHTLRSFLDVTWLHGHSSAVLYLDLSEACDLTIPEAIVGMPEGLPEDRHLEYLRDIGLAEEKRCVIKSLLFTRLVSRLLSRDS